MIPEIATWYNDLDLERLRVKRPSKFLFLCGGARETRAEARAANLRDYLLRVRPIRTKYDIVLAEEATQIYRDTAYSDLITFEEDIARIASVVLFIAESAGSLAELGSFTTNDTIRKALRVVLPSHHETAESFVRYGPVQRLKNEGRTNLGIYPWKMHQSGGLNVSSVKPHYKEIVKFINSHLEAVPKSYQFSKLSEDKLFYIIYWIVNQCLVITPSLLSQVVSSIEPSATAGDVRNKIYCMQIANWIKRESYSGDDYFYAVFDDDPFDYSYKAGVIETSAVRRKIQIQAELKKIISVPSYVTKVAAKARVAA